MTFSLCQNCPDDNGTICKRWSTLRLSDKSERVTVTRVVSTLYRPRTEEVGTYAGTSFFKVKSYVESISTKSFGPLTYRVRYARIKSFSILSSLIILFILLLVWSRISLSGFPHPRLTLPTIIKCKEETRQNSKT